MQSSLAIVLSLTLGFSPHPCVSIFGTGYCMIFTRSFSWKLASMTSVLALAFHPLHAFAFSTSGFAWISATSLAPALPAAGSPSLLRHSFIHTVSTGISTCCPSTTPLGLALGPVSYTHLSPQYKSILEFQLLKQKQIHLINDNNLVPHY